jgi:threonylcarbamoyladenosine tRNA methylthiotransferase MtaB
VNTCAVTEKAAMEARKLVRSLRRRYPEALVVATGCLAQTEPESLHGPALAHLVLGQFEKASLLERLPSSGKPMGPAIIVSKEERLIRDLGHPRPAKTRAFHKIQDGCSAGCAYCAVPLARGRSRSSPMERVISELRAYLDSGIKEIVLTGIHLGHWGLDLDPPSNLERLLDSIENSLADGLEGARMRLSSLEPLEIPLAKKKLLEGSWLVPHLHAPIQSGSDKILKAMGRPYKAAEAERVLAELKGAVPDLSLGADILTCFPGETEEDFEATVSLVERVPFSRLHVFPFSPRKGTRAASLPGAVPEGERRRRLDLLRSLAAKKEAEFLSAQIGKTRLALVEGPRPRSGRLSVLTDNYIRALLPPGSPASPGELRKVEILGPGAEPALAEAALAESARGDPLSPGRERASSKP